jgi:GH35 family endo-1,4-beta-xylanase
MPWSSIETTQNEFDWNESDYLYNVAERNGLAFTWSIKLDVEYQPKWIKNAEKISVKERLLHFIGKICERYEKVA